MKESQKIKVSIIIPVYNADKYLNRCLESVLNQTLKDIEIIIVNDGSTDKSLEVLHLYQQKDSRLIVINKENEGQSVARNLGLEYAKGEYIGFLDADDWIEPNMYERMYNLAITSTSDIIVCNHTRVHELSDKREKKFFDICDEMIDLNTYGRDSYIMNYIRSYRHGNEVWSRLYKRSLILNHQIQFSKNNFGEKVEIGEDLLFNLETILHANHITAINEDLYYYFIREGSSMTSYKPLLFMRMIQVFKIFIDDCHHILDKNKIKQLRLKLVLSSYKEEYERYLLENRQSDFKKEWIELKKSPFVQSVLREKLNDISFKDLIFKNIIKYNYYSVYYKLKNFTLKLRGGSK